MAMAFSNTPGLNRFLPSAPGQAAALMPVYDEVTELCESIGASDFTLLSLTPGKPARLSSLLDCAFPEFGTLTQTILTAMPAELLHHAAGSTIVTWWATPNHPSRPLFQHLRWAVEAGALSPAQAGFVFPLHAGRSEQGLLVMSGADLAVDESNLYDMHDHALRLFEEVLTLRMASSARQRLSKRELECLRLTADGQTSEQIAAALGLSIHTANQYLSNAGQKLNAVNRMHAVAKALRLGLID